MAKSQVTPKHNKFGKLNSKTNKKMMKNKRRKERKKLAKIAITPPSTLNQQQSGLDKKIKITTPKSNKEIKNLAVPITPPSTSNLQQSGLNKEIRKNKRKYENENKDLAVPIAPPTSNQQQSLLDKKVKKNKRRKGNNGFAVPITPPSTLNQQRAVLNKEIKKNKPKNNKENKELAVPNTPPSTSHQQLSVPQTPIEPDIIMIDSDSDDQDSNEESSNKNNAYLTKKDLKTLRARRWLNDSVIDASLKLLKEKYDKDDRVHISSSFFYTRLISAKTNKEGYYGKTKKWLDSVNLFDKKLWLVPVCQRSHWFLAAVTNPGKKRSTIFMLNSMKSNTQQVATNIRNFLLKKFRKEEEGKPKLRLPKIMHPSVPQQNNTYDCGLYLLRFAVTAMTHKTKLTESIGKMQTYWQETPLPNRDQLRVELRERYHPQ